MDTIRKVSIQVDASTTGPAKTAFTDVAKGADQAAASVKKMEDATKQSMKATTGIASASGEMLKRWGQQSLGMVSSFFNPLTLALTAAGAGFAYLKAQSDQASASMA